MGYRISCVVMRMVIDMLSLVTVDIDRIAIIRAKLTQAVPALARLGLPRCLHIALSVTQKFGGGNLVSGEK